MFKFFKSVYERFRPYTIQNPEQFALTNEIQDAVDRGHIKLVELLIASHPEAATTDQKAWLKKQLAKPF